MSDSATWRQIGVRQQYRIHVNNVSLWHVEKGERKPSRDVLVRIALRGLSLTVDQCDDLLLAEYAPLRRPRLTRAAAR